MNMPRVLVTGARGFVGEAVVFRLLLDRRVVPVAAARGETRLKGLCPIVSLELGDQAALPDLNGIDVIVHAAARVHVMDDSSSDPLAEYRRVNVDGTLQLAQQASAAGVKRFIFISSIKVNGEQTEPDRPFTALDRPMPKDPYGVSKLEAELALQKLAQETGMEVVIIRPPLVYGPGVRANFLSMMRWLDKGVPLPFGAIDNRRSLVSLTNLVDLVVTCIDHPKAAGQVFLVSDGEDLSTTTLLSGMARALGKTAALVPLPAVLLTWPAKLLGKGALAQRLCGSLQVDIRHTREVLGWTPPSRVERALRQTADYYLDTKNR
ncbi:MULTISPECIES: UDP-glucose 4-epimerase family protein [Pseudomonas]|uniref:Putative UDP-glucose 4-epimerase n=1 Tax=Pseudomonas fluorescens (strain Pf0-1) TaxID=205922 RepID=Q3K8W3_PSEPF|nr:MULTISPECIES: SDR family oxidoreductase [Pseudomonas]ABA75791.1 putative UDP-glucose 4-epimerase [Pseudomonas fluorescens Pf0-1]MBL0793591.1 SDR family oxidoreductase [Pseudomonas sp. B7]MBX8625635.1 SDR family oxidoreductase [Pseudomonas glycinae]MBY9025371.1 SDR family oxidoreductase [Pseudomonas fluorescens]MBY9031775.1 SDR family oxidoreductase [Pseudomonas fluorescens]